MEDHLAGAGGDEAAVEAALSHGHYASDVHGSEAGAYIVGRDVSYSLRWLDQELTEAQDRHCSGRV